MSLKDDARAAVLDHARELRLDGLAPATSLEQEPLRLIGDNFKRELFRMVAGQVFRSFILPLPMRRRYDVALS